MTPRPDDSVQAVVAEFEAAVDRSARAMAAVLEDLLTEVKRAAEVVALRLRNATVPVQATEATEPTATPPATVAEPKRTQARRAKLNTLWAVRPPLFRAEIAAELNAIKPGADLTPNDVGVWASSMGLPRRDGVGGVPTAPLPTAAVPPPGPAPVERPAGPASTTPKPSLESPRQSPAVPFRLGVQPVEALAEPASRAAAPVAPKPKAESPHSDAPRPITAGMVLRPVAAPFAPLPSFPAPAPKSNYPKISGSSPAAPQARPAPVPSTDPVAADETYIRDWAAQRGILSGRKLDMAQINARRRRLGLAPFADPADSRPARQGARA